MDIETKIIDTWAVTSPKPTSTHTKKTVLSISPVPWCAHTHTHKKIVGARFARSGSWEKNIQNILYIGTINSLFRLLKKSILKTTNFHSFSFLALILKKDNGILIIIIPNIAPIPKIRG